MDMQELEITINNDGRVQIAVRGVHGEECISLTQSLEEALGEVNERNFTPGYFEEISSETRQTTRNHR
jgi:hypothetical protein